MEEPESRPRDDPHYLPPSATAPPETILDADDLAVVRDKLRAGHNVVVGSHGHILVSHEPVGPPMTAEAEAFIEARLGEVRRLALHGVSTQIKPDGTMAGTNPVGRIQYSMGPDPSFTADEIAIMENAILSGGRVSVRPDGSIFTAHYPNDRQLTSEENQARLVEFRSMRDRGDFQRILDSGETVQIVEERIVHGVLDHPLPPGIEFPEPEASTATTTTPEPPTAAQLATEAKRLADEAATIRQDGRKAYVEESERAALERDAAARREWSAEQEANAADQQVAREYKLAEEQKVLAEEATSAAGQLEAVGRSSEAREMRELAQMAADRAETALTRIWVASDRAEELRSEAKQMQSKKVELEAELTRIEQRQKWADKAADGRERRAELLESASKQLAEADRLDDEAAKARADGDAVAADDIKRAADYTRSLGEADRARALEVELPSIEPIGEGSGAEPVRLPPPVAPDVEGSIGRAGGVDTDPLLGDGIVSGDEAVGDEAVGNEGAIVAAEPGAAPGAAASDPPAPGGAVAVDASAAVDDELGDLGEPVAGPDEGLEPVLAGVADAPDVVADLVAGGDPLASTDDPSGLAVPPDDGVEAPPDDLPSDDALA